MLYPAVTFMPWRFRFLKLLVCEDAPPLLDGIAMSRPYPDAHAGCRCRALTLTLTLHTCSSPLLPCLCDTRHRLKGSYKGFRFLFFRIALRTDTVFSKLQKLFRKHF